MTACKGIREYMKERKGKEETEEQFIQRIIKRTEMCWDKTLEENQNNFWDYDSKKANFYGTFIPFSKEDYNRIESLLEQINLSCERFKLILFESAKNYVYLKPETKDDKS